jgi:hypothetical protein
MFQSAYEERLKVVCERRWTHATKKQKAYAIIQNADDEQREVICKGSHIRRRLIVCAVEAQRPPLHSDGKLYRVRRAISAVCEGLLCTSDYTTWREALNLQ